MTNDNYLLDWAWRQRTNTALTKIVLLFLVMRSDATGAVQGVTQACIAPISGNQPKQRYASFEGATQAKFIDPQS